MKVYESVGSYLMVNECILKDMNINEPIWWFRKVYDSVRV